MATKKTKEYIAVLAFVLGAVFVFSAAGKMTGAARFGELISSYGLEWFSILAPVIIIAEMVVGLCMVLRIAVRQMAIFSALLLLCFTSAFFYGNVINGVKDCGCFGNLGSDLPPWATYLRNAVLLMMAIAVWHSTPQSRQSTSDNTLKLTALTLFSAICIFWTGNTWKPSSFYMNRFAKPHPLIGQVVKETPLANYLTAAPDSTYLVWVFSFECDGCINSLENIKQYQTGVADRFVALAVTEDKSGRAHQLLGIPFETQYVGETLAGTISVVPTLLYIKEGRVEFVIEQSVPNVWAFKRTYLEMTNEEILKQQDLLTP